MSPERLKNFCIRVHLNRSNQTYYAVQERTNLLIFTLEGKTMINIDGYLEIMRAVSADKLANTADGIAAIDGESYEEIESAVIGFFSGNGGTIDVETEGDDPLSFNIEGYLDGFDDEDELHRIDKFAKAVKSIVETGALHLEMDGGEEKSYFFEHGKMERKGGQKKKKSKSRDYDDYGYDDAGYDDDDYE